jgi:predicted NBD/HSP70 family sugar kinase
LVHESTNLWRLILITARRTKLINTSRILREIWLKRRVSRVEIAESLGLNKSTVTTIVNDLLEEGLVRSVSVGEAGPQGGRKPIYLALDEAYGTVLGIELRPESYVAVGLDLAGDIVFSRSERMRISGSNLADAFDDILHRVEAERERTGSPLLGVGVGIPGVVDAERQLIRKSIPLQIPAKLDFAHEVSNRYDLPILPENDANCCAWGELAFHRNKPIENFLFVLVEFRDLPSDVVAPEKTAVGIGISIEGKVYRGSDSSSGEFRSVFRSDEHHGQLSLNKNEVGLVETDACVRQKFITELSKNLALLVNTFNFNAVFLGGDIEKYQNEVSWILREEIENNWAYEGPVPCDIRFSTHGHQAVAYGAAGMMLDRLFVDMTGGDETGGFRKVGIDMIPGWNRRTTSR